MSGLEDAIRKALERADRSDANQRARIYQAARQALDNGLRNQNITDLKTVSRQRRKLEEVITEIERAESAAVRAARLQATPAPLFDDVFATGRTPDHEAEPRVSEDVPDIFAPVAEPQVEAPAPDFAPQERPEPDLAMADFSAHDERREADHAVFEETPVLADSDAAAPSLVAERAEDDRAATDEADVQSGLFQAQHGAGDGLAAGRSEKKRAKRVKSHERREKKQAAVERKTEKRGRPPIHWGRIVASAAVAALLVVGIVVAGWWWLVTSDVAEESDAVTVTGDPSEPQVVWTDMFKPGDTSGFSTGAAARAEAVNVEGEPALRITAMAEGSEGSVAFALPAAIASSAATRPVIVDFVVRAPQGGGQPVGISCADGTLSGCERHRFTAPSQKDHLVVRLDPGGTPPTRMMISSDLNGDALPLDVYSVQARVVE
ncbi:hypothetical protein FJU08_20010 [Martelella alba]|uniref:Uncharacterized protein n=1 Tax=Martelella alba TaxID=2590451 RepID=A0A506U3A1_9HYPH|nr:hypothetical protein [Martelella alba]TPW27504.1 hypothetical protein FJU08_20010 [Martelella alba]